MVTVVFLAVTMAPKGSAKGFAARGGRKGA